MITIAILINGNPLLAINAINKSLENGDGQTLYLTTEGQKVWHKRSDGAVVLAKKLLDCIKNDSSSEDKNETK